MKKTDIINYLADCKGYTTFLECVTPTTGNEYASIDRKRFHVSERLMYRARPDFDDGLPIDYRTESEDSSAPFQRIARLGRRYDVILVDPFHSYRCTRRDLRYAFDLLSDRGTIVVHDCNPPDLELASPTRAPGSHAWCGLTYAAFIDFVSSRRDLEYCTVDTDYGCGIIRRILSEVGSMDPHGIASLRPLFGWRVASLSNFTRWPYFVRHRQELLRLVSPRRFLELEGRVEGAGTGMAPGLCTVISTRTDVPRWDALEVPKEIDRADAMWMPGGDAHYFAVGRSAFENIALALASANKHQVKKILDLPCGHGRVLRVLRAAFPQAEITACDLNRAGVEFCARAFGALPVYSEREPEKIPATEHFDLIWVGSLLTHLDAALWQRFIQFFSEHLVPGGVLIFTTHGRFVDSRIGQGMYGLRLADTLRVRKDFRARGFGYANYPAQTEYGISVSSPVWVLSQLERHRDLRCVWFAEQSWDNHQDVYGLVKQEPYPLR